MSGYLKEAKDYYLSHGYQLVGGRDKVVEYQRDNTIWESENYLRCLVLNGYFVTRPEWSCYVLPLQVGSEPRCQPEECYDCHSTLQPSCICNIVNDSDNYQVNPLVLCGLDCAVGMGSAVALPSDDEEVIVHEDGEYATGDDSYDSDFDSDCSEERDDSECDDESEEQEVRDISPIRIRYHSDQYIVSMSKEDHDEFTEWKKAKMLEQLGLVEQEMPVNDIFGIYMMFLAGAATFAVGTVIRDSVNYIFSL